MDDYAWVYQAYDVFANYDTGIKLDYILIYLLGACFTFHFAKKLSIEANNKKWWKYAITFACIFAVIEGCRYLRGTDYLNYGLYYKYDVAGNKSEFIYNFIQAIFHKLKIPFYGTLIFNAFVWIVCLLFGNKDNKKILLFLLPITLVFSWQSTECYIRQCLAFSFIFPFLSYLLRNNYIYALIFALIAFFIHNVSIVFIFILLSIYCIKRHLVDVRLYIIFYLLAAFILKVEFLSIIQRITSFIPFVSDTVLGRYIDKGAQWFSIEAAEEHYSRSFISKSIVGIFDVLVMYLCYIHQKKNKSENIVFFYNLFCITNIFLQLCFNFQVLRRIFIMFYISNAYLIGYIMLTRPIWKYESYARLYIKLYVIIYFIKTILFTDNQLFIWDAVGKYNFNLY